MNNGSKLLIIAGIALLCAAACQNPASTWDPVVPVFIIHPQGGAIYHLNEDAVELFVEAESADGGTLSYQWMVNTDDADEGGSAIRGATEKTFTPPTDKIGVLWYYCRVTNTRGGKGTPRFSGRADVEVVSIVNAPRPRITSQPQGAVYTVHDPAIAMRVTASVANGNLSYRWYFNTEESNEGGTPISGAAGAENFYTPPTNELGITYYYVIVTNTIANNGDGGNKSISAASYPAKIDVNNLINARPPVITEQPAEFLQFIENNPAEYLTVTATASGGGRLSYQWYENPVASNTGESVRAIPGAEDSRYMPPSNRRGTMYYFVIVTNTIADNGDGGNKAAEERSDIAEINIIERPPLAGEASIVGLNHYRIDTDLEVDVSAIDTNTSEGSFRYLWHVGGDVYPLNGRPSASFARYRVQAADVGKSIYCEVSHSVTMGTITTNAVIVPYDVKVDVIAHGTVGDDWVSVVPVYGYDDDSITLHYTLTRAQLSNRMKLYTTGDTFYETVLESGPAPVYSGTFTYTLDSGDADEHGVIWFYAEFIHDDRPIVPIMFETSGTATIVYGQDFVNPIDNTGLGDGAITYWSSNEDVATVDENGEITTYKPGIITIHAEKEEDSANFYDNGHYTLHVNKRPIGLTIQLPVYDIDDPQVGTMVYNGTTEVSFSDYRLGRLYTSLGGDEDENSGIINSDDVNVAEGTIALAGKNVGQQAINYSGWALSGEDADKYDMVFDFEFDPLNAERMKVTVRPLYVTVEITTTTKVYDGTKNVDLDYAIDAATGDSDGVVAVDDGKVGISGTMALQGKNVGTQGIDEAGISLTLTGLEKDNYLIGNYAFAGGTSSVAITARDIALNLAITGATKTYDGTAAFTGSVVATLTQNNGTSGLIAGDTVTITNGTVAYDDTHAGSPSLSESGYGISGADSGNYTLTDVVLSPATATISPKQVSLAVTVDGGATSLEFTPLPGENTASILVSIPAGVLIAGDTAEVAAAAPFVYTPPVGPAAYGTLSLGGGGTADSVTFTANLAGGSVSNASDYTFIPGTPLSVNIVDGSTEAKAILIKNSNFSVFNAYVFTTAGLTKWYKLTEDITLAAPTGGAANPSAWAGNDAISWGANWVMARDSVFTGGFDGNSKKIVNLAAWPSGVPNSAAAAGDNGGTTYTALFNVNEGTIKNLIVENLCAWDVLAGRAMAGIAVQNKGAIQNCTVKGSILATNSDVNASNFNHAVFGGIALINLNTISGCTVEINTFKQRTASINYKGGGIAALNGFGNVAGTISGCTVTITGTLAGNNMGGIAGENGVFGSFEVLGTITGCTVTNNGVIDSMSNGPGSGGNIGGIAGTNYGIVRTSSVTGGATNVNFPSFGVGGIGGIVGRHNTNGDAASGCVTLIEDCFFKNGTITALTNQGAGYGGIAGAGGGNIKNCYIDNVTINASWTETVGGIVGSAEVYNIEGHSVEISGCYVLANCSITGDFNVGGIAGSVVSGTDVTVNITGCYNKGDVTGTGAFNFGGRSDGGIVGNGAGACVITDCYNTGAISNKNQYVGGIAGRLTGTDSSITRCYNTGDVEAQRTSGAYAGGIVGQGLAPTYSVALNQSTTSISASGIIGRIGGDFNGATGASNYADSNMTLAGSPYGAVSDVTLKDGESITSTQWNSASWWQGLGFTAANGWTVADNNLPTLEQ